MTEQQRANALFKKFQGKADTSPYLEFYEEPLRSSFIVTPENFWIDTEYIPETAPLLQDQEEYIVTFDNGFKLPVLKRYNKLYLDAVPGSDASFYHKNLEDAIPHDYKDGSYHYTLRDANDQEIAYGLNAWVVDFQAGVVTFYQGVPEKATLPLSISFYKYIGRKTFEGVIKTDGTTPMVDEYSPDRNQDVTTKKYVDDGLAVIQEVVDKLVPDPPPGLSNRPLLMQLYKAYSAEDSEEHDCTNFLKPEIHVDGAFYDGDAGILTAFIDDEIVGTATLTPEDDTNIYDGIEITSDTDPYAGENQRKNFYKHITALFSPTEDLEPGLHTAKIQHSITGASQVKSFWKDDPSIASIRIASDTPFLPSTVAVSTLNVSYVSGVPTLTPDSFLPIKMYVANVAKTHYPEICAKITSSHVQNEDFNITSAPGTTITLEQNLRVRPNVYTEQLQLQIIALNSAKEPFIPDPIIRKARIDTVSKEAQRVTSGNGIYPSDDAFGLAYPSSQVLSANEELQMIGGILQWPSGDYSANIPVGPNYNNISSEGTRWATFRSLELLYADGFTVHINGAQNWTANAETHRTIGVEIQAKIRNNEKPSENTGWIDCNTPYIGVGKPSANGDTAMVVSGSTATIKRVSFGPTARSGQLYIRIGLTHGSKRFSTITVTPN